MTVESILMWRQNSHPVHDALLALMASCLEACAHQDSAAAWGCMQIELQYKPWSGQAQAAAPDSMSEEPSRVCSTLGR